MQIQRSPNWWSCLPTAFAITLDIPVRTLIGEIGHDGSELIFPNLSEPYSRRGFHIQELIAPCLVRGNALLIVEAVPVVGNPESNEVVPITFKEENMLRLMKFMAEFIGVVAGENEHGVPHAVAWDTKFMYDPNKEEPTEKSDFNIREFFALVKSNQPQNWG
jgi:hypothetical protein